MKQLIVNADDLGMTAGVNRGILEAHRAGIVTSATLMATGMAFAAAVAACREAPGLGIGVHLNLSEGLPVSPAARIPTLVDAQGRLHWTPERLWRAVASRSVRLPEIETELRAQIVKVLETGITPTHLDGHMHVHVLPSVSKLVVRVAREFRIPAVRCPIEPLGALLGRLPKDPEARVSSTNRRLVSLGVSGAARRLRSLLDKAGLFHPDRFYGIVQTGFLNLSAIQKILYSLPDGPGSSEMMCHPGYVDSDLPQVGGRLQAQRECELRALTSPDVARLISTQGIRLSTYRDLCNSKASGETAA